MQILVIRAACSQVHIGESIVQVVVIRAACSQVHMGVVEFVQPDCAFEKT